MRPRLVALVPLLSTLLILAGCTAPAAQPGADSGSDTPSDDIPPAVTTWTDCTQWHLHFDARAEDFASEMPPGFTPVADANGLTQLLIHVTRCAATHEALIAVPVTAPPEHEDPERAELAVLQVFHAGHATTLYPAPFAPRLVDATFEEADTPLGPGLVITGGGETFDLRLALAESSGPFGAEHWARYAHDGTTLGILTADGNESSNEGFGPVAYTHTGPGGAPPATAGIAHVVSQLDITFTAHTKETPA